ncbi:helix-turn-helix transcriptional regulator [Thomasclavelia sp.]|uniref:helix-turn-helix domain-containing protein n=1 Tax=Thomasclavelia sp. TaxID=3025757 RepID=UPI0025E2599E|nr:helix-turn-helix transcriptional regulator [Thomasclavelia sp.]
MNDNFETILIGKYIKSLRLKKGWSQAKLEKISGISASTISNIETGSKGETYNISITNIIKIAHALEISFLDLLTNSGFLLSIGDQKFDTIKSEIYISNYELINIFNRLGPSQQQYVVKTIKSQIASYDQKNQKKLVKTK